MRVKLPINGAALSGEGIDRPSYYVVAADTAWARQHLDLGGPTVFVDHDGVEEPCEKLFLMSQRRHHVIANSTFGCWGAWLANSPEQIAVAPLRWRADASIDELGLRPRGWLAIA